MSRGLRVTGNGCFYQSACGVLVVFFGGLAAGFSALAGGSAAASASVALALLVLGLLVLAGAAAWRVLISVKYFIHACSIGFLGEL